MAKQAGIITLDGAIDNISFFKTKTRDTHPMCSRNGKKNISVKPLNDQSHYQSVIYNNATLLSMASLTI